MQLPTTRDHAPPEEGQLPAPFGRYTLRAVLGEGGMGRVYRAELVGPAGFRKHLALKVIRGVADDGDARAFFEQEARIGGLLRHPNIVDIYDFGFVGPWPFLAMEWVVGTGLDQILREGGALPPRLALRLAAQVARGLAHAHGLLDDDGAPLHVVHRDLKPGNVLVTKEGLAKITDFGLARVTRGAGAADWSGVVRGTPAYMSPEQARGDALDGRSDLFALGAMLYEMVTGRRIFGGESLVAVMMAIVTVDQKRAQLDDVERLCPGLGEVLRRLLVADRDRRYVDATALGDALEALLLSLPADGAAGPATTGGKSGVGPGLGGSGAPGARGPWVDTLPTQVPSVAPAPSTAATRLTNLRQEAMQLHGRAALLSRLDELLAANAPLITLHGPGGTGKTRLVRQWAQGVIDRFRAGGLWFVELAHVRRGDEVALEVARTLSIPLAAGAEERIQRVGDALESRGDVLLVLDNVEQAIPDVAPMVGQWIARAPLLRIVVTTRERLHLPAEQVVEVDPLGVDAAVQLFAERAATARPGWQLLPAERATVEQIVERLDGIPLAIELAAARIAVLPPRQILERLSQRFQILASARKGGDPRQQTLRATLEWSWQLLDAVEQRVLTQLAVFRGGFELAAAEAIVDLSDLPDPPFVIDVVQQLRDKSLVRVVAPQGGGDLRLALLLSVREFAEGRGDAPRDTALAERHAAYFADWAAGQGLGWASPPEGDLRRRLTAELENLRAAMAASTAGNTATALPIMRTLDLIYRAFGPFDARVALATARAALRPDGVDEIAARALADGEIARGEGRLDDARHAFEAVTHSAEAAAVLRVVAEQRLAEGAHDVGDHQRGAAHAAEALKLARTTRDPILEVRALGTLAFSLSHRGGFAEEAVRCHDDVRRRAKALGLLQLEAEQENRLGVLAMDRGDVDPGVTHFRRALDGFRAAGARLDEAKARANLGLVLLREGAFDEARVSIEQATEALRWLGDRRISGGILSYGAILRALTGEDDAAEQRFDEACGYATSAGSLHLIGMCHVARGFQRLAAGRFSDAHADFAVAADAYGRNPALGAIASALGGRAAAARLLGLVGSAEADRSSARAETAKTGHRFEVALLDLIDGWFDFAEAAERAAAGAEVDAFAARARALAAAQRAWALPRVERQAMTLLAAHALFRQLGVPRPAPPRIAP